MDKKERPVYFPIPVDVYYEWMEEDIREGRLREEERIYNEIRKRAEFEKGTASTGKGREEFEGERNIQRDRKGRLNKGALLAKKNSCDEIRIMLYHGMGMSVKDIVEHLKCSKTTVYRVIGKYKKR